MRDLSDLTRFVGIWIDVLKLAALWVILTILTIFTHTISCCFPIFTSFQHIHGKYLFLFLYNWCLSWEGIPPRNFSVSLHLFNLFLSFLFMSSDSGPSMNIMCEGNKSPMQRGSFKNSVGDLLPALRFLGGLYNFCSFAIVFSLM